MPEKAVRIIQKANYNAHTQPIFVSLDILPLPELIYQQKLHWIHAFILNYLPNSFENFILLNNQVHVHNYIFRIDRDFVVSLANTEFLKRFPFYSFPLACNNLPNNLKHISSKNFFALTLNKIWFKLVWTINVIVFYVMNVQMFKKIRFSLFIFLLFCSNCIQVVLKSFWRPFILGCVGFLLSRLSLVKM